MLPLIKADVPKIETSFVNDRSGCGTTPLYYLVNIASSSGYIVFQAGDLG
jgi:hypothetical protein